MFCCFSLRRLLGYLAVCLPVLGFCFLPVQRSVAAVDTVKTEAISLPIIMYHSIMPTENNPYTVSPKRLEEDLIFLRQNGYTTVFMSEVIEYVNGKKQLTKNPVLLTFDDGHYNNYYYVLPLLQKYDAKILFSPIGRCLDDFSEQADSRLSYSYVTWAQLREMAASGHVEIGNHSYDLHKNTATAQGIRKLSHESTEAYHARLLKDLGGMQERFLGGLGSAPLTMTYPFGFYSKETIPLLKTLGFKASLTCEERLNTITKDPERLYNLGRYLRLPSLSSKEFFTKTVGFT